MGESKNLKSVPILAQAAQTCWPSMDDSWPGQSLDLDVCHLLKDILAAKIAEADTCLTSLSAEESRLLTELCTVRVKKAAATQVKESLVEASRQVELHAQGDRHSPTSSSPPSLSPDTVFQPTP